jgi:hypothetical protein
VAKLVDAEQRLQHRGRSRSDGCSRRKVCWPTEEPCPYWEPTKQVTDALRARRERRGTGWDLATRAMRMSDARGVDIVQPDVMYMGGISRTLKVARMAAAAAAALHPGANLSWSHCPPCTCSAHCRMSSSNPSSRSRARIITPGRKAFFWRTRTWSATGT